MIDEDKLKTLLIGIIDDLNFSHDTLTKITSRINNANLLVEEELDKG